MQTSYRSAQEKAASATHKYIIAGQSVVALFKLNHDLKARQIDPVPHGT
jgi:hypothetical protein